MAYGKVQIIFYLKQLLFIANEKNDELSVDEYRNKYIEISSAKNNTEELFLEFKGKEILYPLIKKIYDALIQELSQEKNKGKSINDLFKNQVVCIKDSEDNENPKDINEIGEICVTEELGHYDCHIVDNSLIINK